MNRYRSLLGGVFLLLLGCGATAPVPEDRFYQLQVAVPEMSRVGPLLSGGLLVDRVGADPLRSGRSILYVDVNKPLELKRYHYEFWVEQPPGLVRRALQSYLAASGLVDRVVLATERPPARYRLSTRLQRFEQLRDSGPAGAAVEIELEASLSETETRAVLWTHHYRQQQPVIGPGMHATAAAMERALSGILEQLDRDLAASASAR